MEKNVIFIRHDMEKKKVTRPGRVYRLMYKSHIMEGLIAEFEPQHQSRWFKHNGEEMHLVLHGEMEYSVGEHSYRMSAGDILWHKSTLKHKSKNIGDEKLIYITVRLPPRATPSIL
jgi:mannose-6-phosphate isomerase-like protein (cupin superfamily)